MTDIESTLSRQPGRSRRLVGAGAGFGILGSICCIGSAIAVGAGIGGLAFFTTWMNRYQMYIIAVTIAIMAAWLVRLARKDGVRRGLTASARLIWRQAVVMGAAYGITLLATLTISGLIRGS